KSQLTTIMGAEGMHNGLLLTSLFVSLLSAGTERLRGGASKHNEANHLSSGVMAFTHQSARGIRKNLESAIRQGISRLRPRTDRFGVD
ncbi:MAG: hypothetical protein MI741_10270, partial [Rhodospirillales bacterium]|nr:hypothetical protein [Rhodospirillales bacterium]